jgi:hypothetical protein
VASPSAAFSQIPKGFAPRSISPESFISNRLLGRSIMMQRYLNHRFLAKRKPLGGKILHVFLMGLV